MKFIALLIILSSLAFGQEYSTSKKILTAATKPGEKSKIEFEFSVDTESFTILLDVDYDIPHPLALLSDDGVVFVFAFDMRYIVFSKSGIEISNGFLLKDSVPDYERVVVSKRFGNNFILVVKEPFKSLQLFEFDSNFVMLNSIRLKSSDISGIAVSDNFISVSGYSWNDDGSIENNCLLFDETFNIIADFPLKFEEGKFYEEKNYFLGFDSKNVFLLDIGTKTVKYRQNFSELLVLDAVLQGDKILIALGDLPRLTNGSWIYSELILSEFGLSDKVLKSKTIYNEQFNFVKLTDKNVNVDGIEFPY